MWRAYKKKTKKKESVSAGSFQNVKVKKQPNYVEKLDRIFSLYIRLRDSMPNGMCRCISCGKIKPFADMDNGHYWSRMHTGTRWDEDNCNAECAACNRMSGGEHMIGYRENLIKKIGQQRFDFLEVKAHAIVKRDPFVLQQLIKLYEKKVDELIEQKGFYHKRK